MKDKEPRPDGNYFGWKFSFFSLILILFTFVAILVFDDPPADGGNKYKGKRTKQDSVRMQKIEKPFGD